MVFENDDELGIQEFREDANYIFRANSISVRLIKTKDASLKSSSDDFLGIHTKRQSSSDIIEINIMSDAPRGKELDIEGYEGRGNIKYEGFCPYYINIENEDTIEFIDNYGYDIHPGEKFRVEMKDEGLYQGQYCYKNFTLYKI